MHERPKSNRHLSQLFKRYLFSVSVSAFVCFYRIRSNVNTTNFRFSDSELSSKMNFSTYSLCERIMYQSTPGIMLIQLCVICEGRLYKRAEFIGNRPNKQIRSLLTNIQTLSFILVQTIVLLWRYI